MPRSPPRNAERDRRDRHHRSDRSSKDHTNEVAKMKEKMRNSLETARSTSGSSGNSKKSENYQNLTAAEHLARTRAIEEIEEGGFQPGSFRSGSASKKDQKSKKVENSHESAIFGPAWKSAEQRKTLEKKEGDVATISLPTLAPPPLNSMAPMVASHMNSEHVESRKATWKAYWTDLRHQFLLEGV